MQSAVLDQPPIVISITVSLISFPSKKKKKKTVFVNENNDPFSESQNRVF